MDPQSIVIVGGSNDIHKPGGKVLKNLLTGGFPGDIFAVNPEETEVQGVKSFMNIRDLPYADLAIIAVPPRICIEAVEVLAGEKNTKAFIILSAGFGEFNNEGKTIEERIVSIVDRAGGVLIGPNCIGVMNGKYSGVFTEPLPAIHDDGIDLISGSGATAVFILDAGICRGLRFSGVYSVGNSAQTGIEDLLKYMDENFCSGNGSNNKILYLENIRNPKLLLKHASSLVNRGCRIAAVKAGSSDAGSRAASSHTGAMVTSDRAVDALFRKAGIVRCYSRDELVTVASVFQYRKARGKNFAVITHAGGPGVMLTDTLAEEGLNIPFIVNDDSAFLLGRLNPGSSVSNPIDFLATGTAEQLGLAMDYAEKRDEFDASVVIFGTPGLSEIYDVYDVLHNKMTDAVKPVYPVLPSVLTAAGEVKAFTSKGHVYFPDEVLLGKALAKVYNSSGPFYFGAESGTIDKALVRSILDNITPGYLAPADLQKLLDACGIERAEEYEADSVEKALQASGKISYPLAMKAVGLVHKSDAGGVSLNVGSDEALSREFEKLIKIPGVKSVIMQPMLKGIELFLGSKYEEPFGNIILCGIGGIFVELINDTSSGLTPLCREEALFMIRSLKSYSIFQGIRGREPVDENLFADIILKISQLLQVAPEISELDLNPLMADCGRIIAADARVNIKER